MVEKHKMHQLAEPFLASVGSIKDAEAKAESIIAAAEEHSGKMIMGAREKAVEIGSKASDEAVREKNRRIEAGRKETARLSEALLQKARKTGEKISSLKLTPSQAREISAGIKL